MQAKGELTLMLNHAFDPQQQEADNLLLILERKTIESGNVASFLNVLVGFTDTNESVRRWQGKLRLGVQGWDNDERELFEVPQVVAFIRKVDEHWPYWTHFFSPDHEGLGLIMLMLMDLETRRSDDHVVSHIRNPDQAASVIRRISTATASLHISSGVTQAQSQYVVTMAMACMERLFGR